MKTGFQVGKGEHAAIGLLCFVGTFGCGADGHDSVEVGQVRAPITAKVLSEPEVWRVAPPVLSAAERTRQEEVDRYLLRQHGARKIVATTQTYDGDIIDWV